MKYKQIILLMIVLTALFSLQSVFVSSVIGACDGGCSCFDSNTCELYAEMFPGDGPSCQGIAGTDCSNGYVCQVGSCVTDPGCSNTDVSCGSSYVNCLNCNDQDGCNAANGLYVDYGCSGTSCSSSSSCTVSCCNSLDGAQADGLFHDFGCLGGVCEELSVSCTASSCHGTCYNNVCYSPEFDCPTDCGCDSTSTCSIDDVGRCDTAYFPDCSFGYSCVEFDPSNIWSPDGACVPDPCAGTDTNCGTPGSCSNCNDQDVCGSDGLYVDYGCSGTSCSSSSSSCTVSCCNSLDGAQADGLFHDFGCLGGVCEELSVSCTASSCVGTCFGGVCYPAEFSCSNGCSCFDSNTCSFYGGLPPGCQNNPDNNQDCSFGYSCSGGACVPDPCAGTDTNCGTPGSCSNCNDLNGCVANGLFENYGCSGTSCVLDTTYSPNPYCTDNCCDTSLGADGNCMDNLDSDSVYGTYSGDVCTLASSPVDCDDNDDTVYPGAVEVCDNKDNDCNGPVDDGVANCGCMDDGSPTDEVCDGTDNDCNQQIDEGGVCGDLAVKYYYDNDCGNADIINSWGKLCRVDDESGNTTFVYDDSGLLIKETKIDNYMNEEFTITYEYDNIGSMKSITDPVGVKTEYNFDILGNIASVTITASDGTSKTISYDYNPTGTIKTINYPGSVSTEFTFTDRDWVQTIKTTSGNSLYFYEFYDYDAEGNLIKVEERNSNDVVIRSASLVYDNFDRLTSTSGAYFGDLSYSYDDVGNRKTKDSDSYMYHNTLTNAMYDIDAPQSAATNRLADDSVNTYLYDSAGNVILRSATGSNIGYTYDSNNQLIGVDIGNDGTVDIKYVYDYRGFMVRKEENLPNFGEEVDIRFYSPSGLLYRTGADFDYLKKFVIKNNGVAVAMVDRFGKMLIKGELVDSESSLSGKSFSLKDSSGSILFAIDEDGDLYFKEGFANIFINRGIIIPTSGRDFLIKAEGQIVMMVNDQGLYLKGPLIENSIA